MWAECGKCVEEWGDVRKDVRRGLKGRMGMWGEVRGVWGNVEKGLLGCGGGGERCWEVRGNVEKGVCKCVRV